MGAGGWAASSVDLSVCHRDKSTLGDAAPGSGPSCVPHSGAVERGPLRGADGLALPVALEPPADAPVALRLAAAQRDVRQALDLLGVAQRRLEALVVALAGPLRHHHGGDAVANAVRQGAALGHDPVDADDERDAD